MNGNLLSTPFNLRRSCSELGSYGCDKLVECCQRIALIELPSDDETKPPEQQVLGLVDVTLAGSELWAPPDHTHMDT